MGQYEPADSRIVTNNPSNTPIEPERTGPREGETRSAGNSAARESGEAGKQEQSETQRWQANEELERERLEPGYDGQGGRGDAGASPRGHGVEDEANDDSLGSRDVPFKQESDLVLNR